MVSFPSDILVTSRGFDFFERFAVGALYISYRHIILLKHFASLVDNDISQKDALLRETICSADDEVI